MIGIRAKYAPGYEGRYIVFDDGRIYSIPRRGTKGGYLKQRLHTAGYPQVNLTNKNGRQSTWAVHRLVMLTYVGPCPEGMEVCHNNGNPADNRLENLRYDTPSDNNLDKRKHGTSGGARNGRAKLTPWEVEEIRLRYSTEDVSYASLARQYGVDKTTIGRVVSGTSWTQH